MIRRSARRRRLRLAARTCLLAGLAALSSLLPVRAEEYLPPPRPTLTIPRLEQSPRLESFLGMRPDGEVEERMARITGFIQREPEDGNPASQKTDVYIGYDKDHFYAAFVAFDREPGLIRANMSPREQMFGDGIVEVQLDTFHDERRAYSFVANPYGVQWDAIWTEGRGFDDSFDTVWRSKGKLTASGYVVLMAIPFRSLRFPPGERQTWGIVFVRDIQRNNESSFWPRVSNRIEGRMNQAAVLEGLEGISPGRNMQFIPYATARSFKALEEEEPGEAEFLRERAETDVGADAKFVFKDSLALDLTLNPDFAQVESDEPQVTVNRRFEVFFPEKRPFFLENAGFFQTPFNLLFTRRIDDPRVGARLTGKAGPYSIGALLIDDETPGRFVPPDDPLREAGTPVPPDDPLSGKKALFGVLRLSRDLFRQSNVGFLYTERKFEHELNRVGGVDGRIKIGENWDSQFQAVVSASRLQDRTDQSGPAYSLAFNRAGRQYTSHIHYRQVDPEFRTRVGFVPRADIRDFHQRHDFRWRPEGPRLIAWGPGLFQERIDDHDGTRLDRDVTADLTWEFRRQTRLSIFKSFERERLRPTDFEALPENRDFRRDDVGLHFETRFTDRFNAGLVYVVSQAVNYVTQDPNTVPPSEAAQVSAELELTFRLFSRLRIGALWLFTRLSDEVTEEKIFTNQILRSRWNLQFTPQASLRLIVQYDVTRVDPDLTSLERQRNLNYDLLFTYRVNPWTAVYAGYNTNFRNAELVRRGLRREIALTDRDLFNDAEQFFVKISYLIRP